MSYMSLTAYEVSGSTSTTNNTSQLYVKLTITTTGSSWNEDGDTKGSITVNGTSYSLNGKKFGYQTTTTLYENTFTITHNTDGSKKVTVSYSFNTQISLGTLTGSKDVTLTTIPRATDISCSGGTIGSSATITLSRKSTSYYHKLYYKMSGQSSNTLIASAVQASSYSWSIPTSFYSLIPSATKLSGTLYCYTYSNSACTTQIGSVQSCSITVSADEGTSKPNVSLTLTTDSTTQTQTGNTTTIIKNYSTVTAASTVSANNNTTIKSYNVVSGGVTKSNTASVTFEKVTSGSFVLTATDNRNYTNSVTKTLGVVEYINPDISFSTEPVLDVDGKLTINVKGSFYNGSFGAKTNSVTCKYYFKLAEDSSYTTGSLTLTKSGNTFTGNGSATGLQYNKTYQVYCSIKDKLSATITTEVRTVSSIPVFDWGKDDFAFHVPVNVDGDLNVKSGAIELNNDGSLSNYGGYIDFHFNKSNEDYTSRIIEDASGHIDIQTPNGLSVAGDITIGGHNSPIGSVLTTDGIKVSSNNALKNITSLDIPEGVWIIIGGFWATPPSTATASRIRITLGSSATTDGATASANNGYGSNVYALHGSTATIYGEVVTIRSGACKVYLNAISTAGTSIDITGSIRAVRIA